MDVIICNRSIPLVLVLLQSSKFRENESKHSYLNQSTIERSPLIYSQINLIKCIKSNEFDKVYSKIWNIFV